MSLWLTFFDLKEAFDSVEMEAVMETLDNRIPTPYIKMVSELYSNFTTRISPFYNEVSINVKREVRQVDTIFLKLFNDLFGNFMRKLQWDNVGVRIDGRQLQHLPFVYDIVLVTLNNSGAKEMLADWLISTMRMEISIYSDSREEDVYERRMGSWCPVHAQRNENIRLIKLCVPMSGSQHDERSLSRAEQEKTSGLGSIQEH